MVKRKRHQPRKSHGDRDTSKRKKASGKAASGKTTSGGDDTMDLHSTTSKSCPSLASVNVRQQRRERQDRQDRQESPELCDRDQLNPRKKIRFTTDEDDDLEASKRRLFGLRQTKTDMQASLHRYQHQVKCLNEEIEELHEKLERLVARHTREQVEECTCKSSKKRHVKPTVIKIMKALKDIEAQEAETRLLGVLQMKAQAEQHAEKSHKHLINLKKTAEKLRDKWEKLVGPDELDEEENNRETYSASSLWENSERSRSEGEVSREESLVLDEDECDLIEEKSREKQSGMETDETDDMVQSEPEGPSVQTIYSRGSAMPSYSDVTSIGSCFSFHAVKPETPKETESSNKSLPASGSSSFRLFNLAKLKAHH